MGLSRAQLMLPLSGMLMLGLSGCAATEYPWYREGLTEAQLKQDEKECAQQARDYLFLHPELTAPDQVPGGGPSGRVVRRTEGDLFRACMNSRGYARVPPPPRPDGSKPDGAK